jgi:ABC-2 type transport system permease protein
MNPRRIFAIVLRYYYLLQGSPMRVFSLYIWVLIDMVLWGFISRYLNSIAAPGFNFVSAFLGAVLLSDFFGRVMLGITTTFFEDVWARNFLNIFASPLRISEYLTGLVITGVVTSATGLVLMLALASALFGLSPFAYGVMLLPFVMILFLSGIALGIFGAAVVLRLGPSSEWFIWPIPAVMAPFVGVFYPIDTLPHWMQLVSHALPPSYVFESVRAILTHRALPAQHLLPATGLALAYLFASYRYFLFVYRRALKSGLIARYSAENAA